MLLLYAIELFSPFFAQNFLDDLAIKTIILCGLPEIMGAFFGTTNVDAASQSSQLSDYIYQSLNHFTTFNYSDTNNFTESSVERTIIFLQIFVDYLHGLSSAWILHCAGHTSGDDRAVFNENLVANMFDFVGKLSALRIAMTADQTERFFAAKSRLMRQMLSFVSVFCGKAVLYNRLQCDRTKNSCDTFGQRIVLETLSATLESGDEIEFVLHNHFDQMLSIDPPFIVRVSSGPANIRTVLKQLTGRTSDNYANNMALWTALDAIENADIEMLSVALEYLAVQVLDVNGLYCKQASVIRRAFYILSQQLRTLAPSEDDATNPQMEVYESVVNEAFIGVLREFRRHNRHEQ